MDDKTTVRDRNPMPNCASNAPSEFMTALDRRQILQEVVVFEHGLHGVLLSALEPYIDDILARRAERETDWEAGEEDRRAARQAAKAERLAKFKADREAELKASRIEWDRKRAAELAQNQTHWNERVEDLDAALSRGYGTWVEDEPSHVARAVYVCMSMDGEMPLGVGLTPAEARRDARDHLRHEYLTGVYDHLEDPEGYARDHTKGLTIRLEVPPTADGLATAMCILNVGSGGFRMKERLGQLLGLDELVAA